MLSANHILYADDDADDREMMEHVFESRSDFELLTFSDGGDLIKYITREKESVCLVVLDINMPRVGGMESLTIIRSLPHFASLPVVIFTTSSNPVDKADAENQNALVIIKPTSIQKLMEVTEQMIDYCKRYPAQ